MFSFFKSGNLTTISKKAKLNALLLCIVYTICIVLSGLGFIYIKEEFLSIIFLMISFALLIFLFFLIGAYFINKYKSYSLLNPKSQKKYTMETLEENLSISEKFGGRLAISENYIFSLFSSFYMPAAVPTSELSIAYFIIRPRRYHFNRSSYSATLYLLTNSNELYKFPLGAKVILSDWRIHGKVLQKIENIDSTIMVGYYTKIFATKNKDKLLKYLKW